MPKIAIFMSDLDGGGAEKVMLNLASGLVQQNIDIDLVLVRKAGPYVSQIPSKVRLIDLKGKSLFRSLSLLIRYLKQEKPSILLSALEDTNIVAILANKLAGKITKVVVTVHNTLSQESKNASNLKRKFVPYLVPWLYSEADAIVAVSHGVAQDLVKLGLSRENITVIYNPIVTSELTTKLQQSLEHPWFLPQQPPIILGVGRLNKQKDFPTLIRAFYEVRKQMTVRLIILGEGEERANLEFLIEKLGISKDVLMPGFVQNPYIYMKQASVVVLSSAWEGFGNVIVEAMVSGTPVVSTNCPNGPAEILANGKYGKLVAVGDFKGMAMEIIDTIKKPPETSLLQKRAMDFSLKKIIVYYNELLHKIE